jgi:hypothetical protein
LHSVSSLAFWRCAAYLAVFHFVRQQYGWVALYRRRMDEHGRIDRWLDTAAIYAATVYPLIFWHAHLPRRFEWFVAGDFISGLSARLVLALEPLYWLVLVAFCGRQLLLAARGRAVNHGKVLVVLSTWACWWTGTIWLDSDFAFTVTNVLIHGIPYMVLTYRYGRARSDRAQRPVLTVLLSGGAITFAASVVLVATLEEALWDRLVWHDLEWLFGVGPTLGSPALTLVVPLLAVPQLTHYVLDAFVWRLRRGNPGLLSAVRGG